MRSANTLAAIVLGGTLSPAIVGAAPAPGITPLGDLPGGIHSSSARGVSADGVVVVGTSSTASGTGAFRWTAASGMVGLGGMRFAGSGESFTSGVSPDGSTIVGSADSPNGHEAFRWTAASGMTNLGNFPGFPAFGSGASAASGDGSVVVGTGSVLDQLSLRAHAFRWTAATGLVDLGGLPSRDIESGAADVSADGSTVVGQSKSVNTESGTGTTEAFRWTAATGMVGLGDLPGGVFNSRAVAVSADGSTVVGISVAAGHSEAFRWTAATGMVSLADMPGGGDFSHAWDVSPDGSTVVGFSSSGAFRWTAAGGMERLWDVLLAHGVDPAADGWTALSSANGISADGRTFVGSGYRDGNLEAFVATVPEPGALSLLGLVALASRRRRARSARSRIVDNPGREARDEPIE